MTGLASQLAASALTVAREIVRLTPGVVSLLAHHSTAALTVGVVLLAIILIVRHAVVLLVAVLAVTLLVSATRAHQTTTVQTTGSCPSPTAQRSPDPHSGGCPVTSRPDRAPRLVSHAPRGTHGQPQPAP